MDYETETYRTRGKIYLDREQVTRTIQEVTDKIRPFSEFTRKWISESRKSEKRFIDD